LVVKVIIIIIIIIIIQIIHACQEIICTQLNFFQVQKCTVTVSMTMKWSLLSSCPFRDV